MSTQTDPEELYDTLRAEGLFEAEGEHLKLTDDFRTARERRRGEFDETADAEGRIAEYVDGTPFSVEDVDEWIVADAMAVQDTCETIDAGTSVHVALSLDRSESVESDGHVPSGFVSIVVLLTAGFVTFAAIVTLSRAATLSGHVAFSEIVIFPSTVMDAGTETFAATVTFDKTVTFAPIVTFSLIYVFSTGLEEFPPIVAPGGTSTPAGIKIGLVMGLAVSRLSGHLSRPLSSVSVWFRRMKKSGFSGS